MPKLELTESIALAVSSAVYNLSANANGNPEDNSIQVNMYLSLFLESGKGPTMSTASFSQRSEIILGSTMGTFVLPDLLNLLHLAQD